MENKIIRDIDDNNYQEVQNKITTLINLKEKEKEIRNTILELENDLEYCFNKEKWKTLSLIDKNLRITITPAKETQVIDYLATLEQVDNVEPYYQMIKDIDKVKIEKELKDKLITTTKKTKAIVRISELFKDEKN